MLTQWYYCLLYITQWLNLCNLNISGVELGKHVSPLIRDQDYLESNRIVKKIIHKRMRELCKNKKKQISTIYLYNIILIMFLYNLQMTLISF